MTGVCTVCVGSMRWRATCWRSCVTAAVCAPESPCCCSASARLGSICGTAVNPKRALARWHAPLPTNSKNSKWKCHRCNSFQRLEQAVLSKSFYIYLFFCAAVLWKRASTAAARWPFRNVMREPSQRDSGKPWAEETGKRMTACCKVNLYMYCSLQIQTHHPRSNLNQRFHWTFSLSIIFTERICFYCHHF